MSRLTTFRALIGPAVFAVVLLVGIQPAQAQARFPFSIERIEELNPQAEIRLEEGTFLRTRVTSDPGFRLQWRVVQPAAEEGQEPVTIAEVNARGGMEFVPEIAEPGTYQVFLELYFPAYRATSSERKGEFRTISNVVEYVVAPEDADQQQPAEEPPTEQTEQAEPDSDSPSPESPSS